MAALVMGVAGAASAAEPKKEPGKQTDQDSMKVSQMQELVVKAVIAPKNAPFAVSRIGKKELDEFSRTGQELPFLFSRTPGVLAWSENGVGTGTSYMRIRGAAGSRINVTLDGVALNSPEDQCVFWANMNSYASLLGNVHIQRGVGTSTNGDGAFGGSIALETQSPDFKPNCELTGAGGSYGTWHAGGKVGTGLIANHLIIDGAYHHTGTLGYLHGTNGNSGSWYAGATWFSSDRKVKISYKHIGNYEKTGQAWNGVTAGNDDYSLNYYGGVRSYQDMYDMGLGQFNSLYEHYNENWKDPANATVTRYKMSDGSYWPRTTDNFWQNHNLLNATWKINDHWNMNTTLHYTYGRGYYDEFRYNNKLTKFGIAMSQDEKKEMGIEMDSKGRGYADFVRQKGLTQHTYGLVWNLNYQNRKWDVIGGLSLQNFEGNHYGYLTYTSNARLSEYLGITDAGGKYRYYDSDADKLDFQVFAKTTYHLSDLFDIYGDLQYRCVGYSTDGYNDKYTSNKDGSEVYRQALNISGQYNFFNPKVGFSFHKDGHRAYISYAMSHREPERNNYTDNGAYPAPEAESVHDVELGYTYQSQNWYAGLNLYGMFYRNQFVQTGAQSDIGENLTTNIKNSYRLGMELSFGYNPTGWLTIEGNAAISRNQILDFDEAMSVDWEDYFMDVHYDNSTLAFSPTAILNGFLTVHKWGFSATWHTNYVSRQYLDNTASVDRMLPHYTTTAIHLSYDQKIKTRCLKHIVYGCDLNNIFNTHRAAGGWVYSTAMSDGEGNVDPAVRYNQIGYIPMAGFTVMGSIALKF